MGNPIEVYLWALIAVSGLAALIGHGTWVGHAAQWAALGFLLLWLAWTVLTSPHWRHRKKEPAPDADALVERLRAARAGGAPMKPADRAALVGLAANGELDEALQNEILAALVPASGSANEVDVAIAIHGLIHANARALDALLAALPALSPEQAAAAAMAIASSAAHFARAGARLLADHALLRSFAIALADALAENPALAPSWPGEIRRALQHAVDDDAKRRAILSR